MFRSLLFAIGIFLLTLGAQTMVVDKWVMSYDAPANSLSPSNNNGGIFQSTGFSNNRNSYYNPVGNSSVNLHKRVYQTQEWMPWSLLAAGTIIVLYNYSSGRGSISDS